MFLSHPDQIAKNRGFETESPMFPKGVKQMLGLSFAMEGEIFGNASWHAKMKDLRDSMDRGYIRQFDTDSINMRGMTDLEKNAQCAMVRDQVERYLDGMELQAVLAKFGRDELDRTQNAVTILAEEVKAYLMSGRMKRQRSTIYCNDITWNVVCSHALYQGEYSTVAIARRHGVGQSTAWKDCGAAKKCVGRLLGGAYRKLEEKFCDGFVLERKTPRLG